MSETKEGRKSGITYAVKGKTGRITTYLVRGDNHTTGELLYETVANRKNDEKGVMVTTEADFILYYFTACHVLYRFKTKAFRNHFVSHKAGYDQQDRYLKKRGRKLAHFRRITVPGNAARAAVEKQGYLIPLADLHHKQWARVHDVATGEQLYQLADTVALMNAYNQAKRKPRIRMPAPIRTGNAPRKKRLVFTYGG